MRNKQSSTAFGFSIFGLILLAIQNIPILSIVGVAFVFGGFVFGVKALTQIKKTGEKGRWLAITSVIVGSVSIIIFLSVLLISLFI